MNAYKLVSSSLRTATLTLLLGASVLSVTAQSHFPDETEPHEGTWLARPHQYTYGTAYLNSLDATWVAMTAALVGGERVHIIAYNATASRCSTTALTTR
jgi:agmatine deiminase